VNENQFEGDMEVRVGAVEKLAGEAIDNPELEARGAGRRIEGKIKRGAGQLEELIGQAANTASATVSKLSDRAATAAVSLSGQAKDAYEKASLKARKTAETVEPFVHQRPYAALGIAAVAGVVFGVLLAGRGPKVIYVRPHA
jgi:ElaB/YqjD/DUF883 family membrane-anchored ribosome-binding protein